MYIDPLVVEVRQFPTAGFYQFPTTGLHQFFRRWASPTSPTGPMPSQCPYIQHFSGLDRSSPRFPDQLTTLFSEKECRDHLSNLPETDAVWLIEYLDDVRTRHLHVNLAVSSRRRFSTLSLLLVLPPRNAYAYLCGCVALGKYCQRRTDFWALI